MSSLCDQLQATPGGACTLERELGSALVQLPSGKAFASPRTDPRFQALVKRVGAR